MVDNGRYNFIEKMGVVNKHNWGGASCVKSKKTYHVIFSDDFDALMTHHPITFCGLTATIARPS